VLAHSVETCTTSLDVVRESLVGPLAENHGMAVNILVAKSLTFAQAGVLDHLVSAIQ